MKVTAILFVLIVLALGAQAGPPVAGVYYSYDMPGGSFNAGRFAESWAGPGRDGQMGNTVNAMSWDGMALGTEWKLWCPSIQTAPVLVGNTVDGNGNGEMTWRTVYSGGHFFLGAAGPWGDVDYGGDLAGFIVTATYLFVFGEIEGIRSNVTSWGEIEGYTNCMEYEINNAAFFGNTDDNPPMPADYPALLDEDCNTGVWTRGGWGSATQVAIRIKGSCTVASEASTWGRVKALFEK
jgi:hypothetical protein